MRVTWRSLKHLETSVPSLSSVQAFAQVFTSVFTVSKTQAAFQFLVKHKPFPFSGPNFSLHILLKLLPLKSWACPQSLRECVFSSVLPTGHDLLVWALHAKGPFRLAPQSLGFAQISLPFYRQSLFLSLQIQYSFSSQDCHIRKRNMEFRFTCTQRTHPQPSGWGRQMSNYAGY